MTTLFGNQQFCGPQKHLQVPGQDPDLMSEALWGGAQETPI